MRRLLSKAALFFFSLFALSFGLAPKAHALFGADWDLLLETACLGFCGGPKGQSATPEEPTTIDSNWVHAKVNSICPNDGGNTTIKNACDVAFVDCRYFENKDLKDFLDNTCSAPGGGWNWECDDSQYQGVVNHVQSMVANPIDILKTSRDCHDHPENYSKGSKTSAECGNGKSGSGKECEDGNLNDGDGCSKTCKLEGSVLGKVQVTLETIQKWSDQWCEDLTPVGGKNNSSACGLSLGQCKSDIALKYVWPDLGKECGNAIKFGGSDLMFYCTPDIVNKMAVEGPKAAEEKFGSKVSGSCNVNCGNWKLDAGEKCDDGNHNDGDGCSNSCQQEAGVPGMIQVTNATVDKFTALWCNDLTLAGGYNQSNECNSLLQNCYTEVKDYIQATLKQECGTEIITGTPGKDYLFYCSPAVNDEIAAKGVAQHAKKFAVEVNAFCHK